MIARQLTPVLAALAAAAVPARAEQRWQGGLYEIAYRLELPHVERWAIERSARVCLSGEEKAERPGDIPFPVLSANTPFAGCVAVNIQQDGSDLAYDIACEGRDAARAHATYQLAEGRFSGRVSMVMAAKNMTMTEVQAGRRVGPCEAQGRPD